MDVQIALGADICMAFDECTEYPADRSRAEESLRLTMAWARRSLDHFRAHRDEVPWRDPKGCGTQSCFGIVQGGMYAICAARAPSGSWRWTSTATRSAA